MRSLIIAFLLAGLVTGCGEKQEGKTTPKKGKGTENVMEDVKKAQDAMEEAEKEIEKEAEEAEEAEDTMEEESMVAEATAMLADAMQAIKEGSLDEAREILEQLNEAKKELPADLQKQLDSAWAALKAKEAAGGMGIK